MHRHLRAWALTLVVLVPLLAAGTARAHVQYVTPGGEAVDALGFLIATLSDPFNLAVILGGGVAVVGGLVTYLRVRPLQRDIAVWREALSGYRDLLPWMLRLSIGLPLLGAGFSGYLFAPTVTPDAPVFVRLFGVTTGFFLLFGLATRVVAAGALLVYLVSLALNPGLLLAFEYLPGLLAIVFLGGGRPSADDVLAALADDGLTVYSRLDIVYREFSIPFRRRVDPYRQYVPTVVRVGLGVVFFYLGATQKLANPGDSLAVVAKYDLTSVVPVDAALWVVGAGLTEMLVGVLLFVGLFTRAFSAVAFLLLTTTLFGLPDDPVLAHVSVFGLVSALLVTGAGPLSLDRLLATREADTGRTGRSVSGD